MSAKKKQACVSMAKESGCAFLVRASVSANMKFVRPSAKIAGVVAFARTEGAKADVASVVEAKSVSTTGDMAIAKSAKDKVLF